MERIDKLLSHEGYGSRKDIKKLLRNYEVLLNGKQIFDPATQIDISKDTLCIDGEIVDFHSEIYLMMNKIQHTISSNKDGEHQTVFDLLEDDLKTPYLQEKLHLVGRLDMDTEGLLIFTTDGELTHKLISPKSNIAKTYFVSLEKEFSEEEKQNVEKLFQEGIAVGPEDNEQGFICKPAQVSWPTKEICDSICKNSSYDSAQIKTAALLSITEGKYHQVKRMFKAVENKVVFIKRIQMGNLQLDKTLTPGQYKYLSKEEIESIF